MPMTARRWVEPCLIAVLFVMMALAPTAPEASEKAALVIDAGSGEVLHELNANTRLYPASLTKMMTAYVTFGALAKGDIALDDVITASARAAGQTGSRLGLATGTTMTVEEAILGTVLKSGNDAAVALAEHVAGSEAAFAEEMTAQARAIGMSRTVFRNASGLPNGAQVTTARDMVVLAQALINDFPQYYPYFARTSFTFKGRRVGSHNNISIGYPGGDGLKTGFTCAAGYNLVGSAVRDGRRLIAAVLGHPSGRARDARVMSLLSNGFDETPGSRSTTLASLAPVPGDPDPAPDGRWIANSCTGRGPGVVAGRRTGTWSVDLGASTQLAQARNRAASVSRGLSGSLRRGRATAAQLLRNGRISYHALIASLSKDDAVSICRHLRQSGAYCTTISPASYNASREGASRARGRRG